MRVLDAWAERTGREAPSPAWYRGRKLNALTFYYGPDLERLGMFEGPTPDAARIAAADAVYPELPADVRAKLGERP